VVVAFRVSPAMIVILATKNTTFCILSTSFLLQSPIETSIQFSTFFKYCFYPYFEGKREKEGERNERKKKKE
jgi:hypothetical protein